MMGKRKTETYSVKDFMAGKHKTETFPRDKYMSFAFGVDISAKTFLPTGTSPADTLILLVGGMGAFFIAISILEKALIRNGNVMTAEMIASTINFLSPVAIGIYTIYKLCTTF